MEWLTGLIGPEWGLIFLVLTGVVLLGASRRAKLGGARLFGFLLPPLLAGAALLAFLVPRYGSQLWQMGPRIASRPAAIAFAAVTGLVALAVVDLMLNRLAPAAAWVLARMRLPLGWARSAGMALILAPFALASILGISRIDTTFRGSGAAAPGVTIAAEHRVGAAVMDIEPTGEGEGYLSIGDGRIARFTMATQHSLELETVAEGLDFPRGLAIADGALFVGELGSLACESLFPQCRGEHVGASSLELGELANLEASRGRILRFEILPGGRLGPAQVIVDELPVVATDHGVNDLAAGPDGGIYAAIGHVDAMAVHLDVLEEAEHPKLDLLGTVIRFEADGGAMEVYARGLRNVYGLTFDDAGNLYGVDNDGPVMGAWRAEELVRIEQGADHGFPVDGTFGPYEARTAHPLWLIDSVGSAGLEWGTRIGLGDGLLVGSCGRLNWVGMTMGQDGPFVEDRFQVRRLLEVPGCISTVKPGPDGSAVAAIFDADGTILVLSIEPP